MFTLKTPAKIVWEITRKCTRQCNFCYSSQLSHSELPAEEKRRILEEIVACDPLQVVLTGGEPLVETTELPGILQALHHKGIYTQLWTNGDLIDEITAGHIVSNCDLVTLPLMGGIEATHDLHMGEGSFAKIKQSLGFLSDGHIEINFLLTKENYHELRELLKFCGTYENISFITIQTYVHDHNRGTEDLSVTRTQQEELMMELVKLKQEYKDRFLIRLSEETAEIKSLLEDRQFNYQTFIRHDGEVFVNQWVKIRGGNVLETSLKEIWESSLSDFWSRPETKEMFKNFRNINQQGIRYDTISK